MTLLARDQADAASVGLAFTAIVAVRTVLEFLLLAPQAVVPDADVRRALYAYGHQYLSWLCVFLAVVVLLRVFLPLSTAQSATLAVRGLLVTWLVPLLDAVHSGGAGQIRYGRDWGDFLHNYTQLFNPWARIEMVTFGVRVEVFLVVAGSAVLSVLVFGRPLWKALALAASLYTTVFAFGYLPALQLTLARALGLGPGSGCIALLEDQRLVYAYVPVFALLAGALALLLAREADPAFRALRASAHPSRLSAYLMLLGFGWAYGARQAGGLCSSGFDVAHAWQLAAALISIACLFGHAKLLNDTHDLAIDRVSNPRRPLVTGALSPRQARGYAWGLGGLAFLFALVSDVAFVPFCLACWALSRAYSAPPLRLRAFYPAGHLALAGIGTLVFLGGAALPLGPGVVPRLHAPLLAPGIFMSFFLLAHLKDLKDIQGDRAAGVANPFARLARPRLGVALLLAGFCACLFWLARLLGLPLGLTCAGLAAYALAALVLAARTSDLARLDRLIPLALLLCAYLGTLWTLAA